MRTKRYLSVTSTILVIVYMCSQVAQATLSEQDATVEVSTRPTDNESFPSADPQRELPLLVQFVSAETTCAKNFYGSSRGLLQVELLANVLATLLHIQSYSGVANERFEINFKLSVTTILTNMGFHASLKLHEKSCQMRASARAEAAVMLHCWYTIIAGDVFELNAFGVYAALNFGTTEQVVPCFYVFKRLTLTAEYYQSVLPSSRIQLALYVRLKRSLLDYA